MAFGSFQREFFVTTLMIALGASVSVYLFLNFLKLENPETPLESLKTGKQIYTLTSHGKCFGTFESHLDFENNYDLKGDGWLKVRMPDAVKHVRIETDSGFNSLGQLVGFYLFFFINEDLISIGLQEVNPMKATLKVRFGSKEYQVQRELPGPVLIQDNSDGTVRISHWLLRQFRGKSSLLDQQPFLKALDVSVVSDGAGCIESEAEPLDLRAVATGLGTVQNSVVKTLEGMLP